MDRIRKLATGNYLFTVLTVDDNGAYVDPTGTFAVTIRDGAGTVVTTGTPTHNNAAHEFRLTVAAATITTLDTYTLTWTGTVSGTTTTWTSTVEIVGGYIFEIADLRSQDRAFADTTKYPTSMLREIRTWVEDVIEGPRAANVAFVPRGSRVITDGTERTAIMVPDLEVRSVYSVSVSGTAWTTPQVATLTVDDGVLWINNDSPISAWTTGHRNVNIHYTHGYSTPPGAITRAALMLAREYLLKTDIPGRATATSIGDQMFRLTIAGRDGVTGLPEVDAAIQQFGRKSYAIG
jgi:hypothetical protein